MKSKKELSYKQKRSLQQLNNKIIKDKIKEDLEKERVQEDRKEFIVETQKQIIDDKSLIDEFETSINANEPIRELLNAKNIKFKTQLTEEQRSSVSILYGAYLQCLEYGISFTGLKSVLDQYIDFGVSIDRKGRSEFVEASQIYNANKQINNGQNNMNGQINNMKM